MPARILSFLFLLMTTALAASTSSAPNTVWTETQFLGSRAWQSLNGKQLAIVSEQRCRLLYLGAADGTLNLLSAPTQPPAQNSSNMAPNWGGHRFWLGPQQRWVWPPKSEWEFAAAASVHTEGSVLYLTHPAGDKDYPVLTRAYAWEGSRLRCTVSWKDDGRAYYGMHVMAIDAPAEIHAKLAPSAATPEGAVLVRMTGFDTSGVLSHPAATKAGDELILRSGTSHSAKVGLIPQTLRCPRPHAWTLLLHAGPSSGVPIGSSDAGFLTQVWVGQPHVNFAELEQLSPILLGDDSGTCSSTCYIEGLPQWH